LNVQLFDRHPKGIRPTAAGEALAADVRSIFAILDRAENKLSEYAGGHRGLIRIHANPSGLSGALPVALREYLDTHPLVGIPSVSQPCTCPMASTSTIGITAPCAFNSLGKAKRKADAHRA
jgi:DNA-binding transcriptional LysR family regulator